MHYFDGVQFLFFIGALTLLTPLLGTYIASLFSEQSTPLGRTESFCYRISGIDPSEEMSWSKYLKTLLVFNTIGFLSLFLLQLLQGYLPLNPQEFAGTSLPLAFCTAMSFVTNTNWQSYAGETTLSYLTQMLGLTVQNFLSAATGMAALLTLIRGILRNSVETVGNFWVDLVRTVIYLLLPLSVALALIFAWQGTVQTFSPYSKLTTLESGEQEIPLGPVASQIAIKQLGTNGGGFFNTNSAHPFENPTPLTNFLQMLGLMLIPSASVYAYGILIQRKKEGWLLLGCMFLLWLGGSVVSYFSQHIHNPAIDVYPNLEGIETRLGTANSLLWSVSTTATSNGAVNNMISSLSPLSGGVCLLNIMLGEMIFGGVGVGLCSMIMFVLLTVFLSGLMVGRTPEYLGKKIEKSEIKWIMLAVLLPGSLILIGSGISAILPQALSSLGNQGPHGLTEILYAFASAAGNNGSAFAGLNANTDYYNLTLGTVMFLGRLSIIIPSIAIAGLLARKKITPPSIGTLGTDTLFFTGLLINVILIVGALTFFPAFSLGPLVEHLLMLEGRTF